VYGIPQTRELRGGDTDKEEEHVSRGWEEMEK
jgi:hypothetical protein